MKKIVLAVSGVILLVIICLAWADDGKALVLVGLVLTFSSKFWRLVAVEGIKNAEKRHNKAMTAAKIQVPFSRTSVVCLTPML